VGIWAEDTVVLVVLLEEEPKVDAEVLISWMKRIDFVYTSMLVSMVVTGDFQMMLSF
jgi:hypothetical protein